MAKSFFAAFSALVAVIASGAAKAAHRIESSPVSNQLRAQISPIEVKDAEACVEAGLKAARQDAATLVEIVSRCGLQSVDVESVDLMQVSGGSQF